MLLDECCPAPLKDAFTGIDVFTVETAGLKGTKNGDLLKAAEASFDVLITADKSLRYQQNLAGRKLAIVELPFNSWKRLQVMTREIETAIKSAHPGNYIEIRSPRTP